MTDSASSCCFCHGSSWFQTGRPDLPSTTITSRQKRDLALTSVQVWVYGKPPCSGMDCAVPFHDCGHSVTSVRHRNGKSEDGQWLSLSTQPPSLLRFHCPPCLHLIYLFFPIASLCLQHEVQSLVSTEVTWYRLAANLEKETLSPITEKQGFQMEAEHLLSFSILPLKKAGFGMLNRIFHTLRTILTVRNHLLVDQKSEKLSSSSWCLLAILQSYLCGGHFLLGCVDICLSPCDINLHCYLLSMRTAPFCYGHKKLPSPFNMHRQIWPPAESAFPRLP